MASSYLLTSPERRTVRVTVIPCKMSKICTRSSHFAKVGNFATASKRAENRDLAQKNHKKTLEMGAERVSERAVPEPPFVH